MSYEIEMIQEGEVLYVTLRGRSHRERELSDFQLMLDKCLESGSEKVLVDYRELDGFTTGAGEVFQYITRVNKMYFSYIRNGGKPLRLVYLAPRVADFDKEFALTVAENFGFPVMLTFERDQAMEWLDEK